MCRESQFLDARFRKMESVTIEMRDSFSNDGVSVSSIPLSQTTAFVARFRPNRTKSEVGVLFIDISTLEDIAKLPELSEFSVIVHFTSPEVLGKSEYTSLFPITSLNICFLDDDSRGLNGPMRMFTHLNSLNPDLFPLLACEFDRETDLRHFASAAMRDSVTWGDDAAPILQLEVGANRPTPVLPVLNVCQTFHITFLGTSAGFSLADRTTSAILVQTAETFILLDAGRGCFSQIRRHYGRSNTRAILSRLSCIWLSHFHIDHIDGLLRILHERRKVPSAPVLLACCDPLAKEVKRIERLCGDNFFNVEYRDRRALIQLSGAVLESFPVDHCLGSMGCAIRLSNGIRIAYSGDQFADGSFPAAVGPCDVVIHEGTFMTQFLAKAVRRRHSTFEMAATNATEMEAKFFFLTHIGKSIPQDKLDVPHENGMCAFDHLSFAFEDIAQVIEICKRELANGTLF
jgi:ribonuclease Z